MKKIWIVAVCLIAAGLLLCLGVLIAMGSDFSKLSTDKIAVEEYTITDSFSHIEISTDEADVRILPSEDGVCHAVCHYREKVPYQVVVENGTLWIQQDDQRSWYDYISLFDFGKTEIVLYLPDPVYESLTVKGSTGDVHLTDGFATQTTNISVSTGDVTVEGHKTETLTVKTSTGDVNVMGVYLHNMTLTASTGDVTVAEATVISEANLSTTTGRIKMMDTYAYHAINCETSTGGITMENTEVVWMLKVKASTGDIQLKACNGRTTDIETTTGDVTLDACDGVIYNIQTTTGNVKGTMVSDMVFTARSDTGRVEVPTSTRGGSCMITTDTGDIRMEILPKE